MLWNNEVNKSINSQQLCGLVFFSASKFEDGTTIYELQKSKTQLRFVFYKLSIVFYRNHNKIELEDLCSPSEERSDVEYTVTKLIII